ncbi:hypothetical protein GC173_11595 [bacterium]|nr:hypothetical protein [bacterium]
MGSTDGLRLTVWLVALAMLGSCSSRQRVPLAIDPPPPGQVTIHVYRPSYLLWTLRLPVHDGAQEIGTIWARRSLSWNRPAGAVRLETLQSDLGTKAALELDAKDGEAVFVRIQPTLGIILGGGTFTVVDQSRGLRGLDKTHPASVR